MTTDWNARRGTTVDNLRRARAIRRPACGVPIVTRALFLLISLALVACGGSGVRGAASGQQGGYPPDPRPPGKTLVYECGDYEFIARLGPGEMAVWLEDRYMILSRVRSASGVEYREGDTVFRIREGQSSLELDGQRFSQCQLVPARAPWEDARRRGVDFRAVGNEPGWYLEIQTGRQLLFVANYGMQRVVAPDPGVRVQGNTRIYHAVSDPIDLRVEIVDEPCTDTMKGDSLPSQVLVELNDIKYHGCGRSLEYPWQ